MESVGMGSELGLTQKGYIETWTLVSSLIGMTGGAGESNQLPATPELAVKHVTVGPPNCSIYLMFDLFW